ncbi:TIGR04282 family arsenosugar biosynthesis glycosyltransferase [Abyssalbus ytuae]|uniref:TIGR04282 family arsenosugar biosynthesis glycosyltransferase n=1 Tax=Abyssalbus ytuae TaxID=2926907 RepID=A0A9E6ZPX4_9FLAO|nr:TIGR04282 family arsenosugar biosynthesis glycosyltransferase [Abyssalbus ytuae]UOB18754.1 TIGR04282 family arsenosugar biosynthesis glycosyltransferase [Abyssalbus ytuae]
MDNNLLLIFIRNPEPGKVKTRLAKVIGNTAAFEIYQFLLNHTKEITKKLKCNKIIYYSENIAENDIWDTQFYQKKLQKGFDLGIRMLNAVKENIRAGSKIIIIGSDIYDLQSSHIEQAFNKLNKHDVVIGPAKDGGYYLIGLKKEHEKIFKNKPWGTSKVLEQTLENLEDSDVFLLEELNDIDTYNDIKNNNIFKKFIEHSTK